MVRQGGRTWGGTFLANMTITLCGIATGSLAAHLLLPEGRGLLATILFWPQLITGVGILSLHEVVTFRVAQTDRQEHQQLLATALMLALLLAAVTALAGYLLLPWLLGPRRVEWLPVARQYFLAFVPFNFVALSLLAVDHGREHFVRYNLLRIMPPFMYLFGLITLWFLGHAHVTTLVWANWLGTFVTVIIRLLLVAGRLGVRPSPAVAVCLLRTGVSFHLTALFILFSNQMDRLLVISLWEDAAIGFYAVAFTVGTAALGIITNTFHIVMFPRISAAASDATRREIIAKGLRHASLLLVVGTGILMAVTPWLIPFLFGQAFQGAVAPAIALLLAYIPLGLRRITIRSLRGVGEAHPGTVAEVISLFTFVALFWPLARASGLVGIALALLSGNVAALVYLSGYLKIRLGLSPRDWWGLNTSTFESSVREAQRVVAQFATSPK